MTFSMDLLSAISLLNNPIELIKTVGYIGLILIIFAETGLLFGFFLPGDSLLVTAGILAAAGHLKLDFLIISLTLAAIIGDAVGFFIGYKLGDLLYTKKDSFFFRKKHIELAHDFYEKHGGKTIIFARFIPIIRTFAPTVAGAAKMNYLKFATFNVVGGIFWIVSLTLSGYYLGKMFGDKIQEYIHILIAVIILLSIAPLIIKWIKIQREKLCLKK
jgi:membrane-associated protein